VKAHGETTEILLHALSEMRGTDLEFDVEGMIFKSFRTGDKITAGNIVIEPVHVDHSVPGAYGLVVHTSNRAIVYPGDLVFTVPT